MGRRVQFTLEELKQKVDDYFNYCDEENKPYTVVGLANSLGVSRQCLLNYENENRTFIDMSDEEIREFVDTVKRAKGRVLQYAEEGLFTAKNPAGIIFNLKNNWGYKDIQEVNNNIGINNPYEKLTEAELRQLIALEENNNGSTEPTSEVNTPAEHQENTDN